MKTPEDFRVPGYNIATVGGYVGGTGYENAPVMTYNLALKLAQQYTENDEKNRIWEPVFMSDAAFVQDENKVTYNAVSGELVPARQSA